ncbi:MAG: ATP-binding protein [Gaiellaceae bacterium]
MRLHGWLMPLAAGVVVIGSYAFAGDLPRSVLYDAMALVATLACVLAARRSEGARRLSWCLLAAGTAAFAVGDVLFSFYAAFPSTADVSYLAGYPLLAAGMATLVPRSRTRTIGATLDAALATTALGIFVLSFWLEPLFAQSSENALGQAVGCAYPLGDLLLLALLLLALLRAPAQWLLAASMVVLLATDLVYSGLQAHNSYGTSSLLDAGWIASYALLGAAALHPSASLALSPRSDAASWRRLLLVGLCLFAVPAAALLQLLTGSGRVEQRKLIVFGAVIAALACARLAAIARERDRSEQHYRTLIDKANDIVAIVDVDGTVRYASPAIARVLGLQPADYVGRKALAFVHPEDLERARATAEHGLAGEFEEMTCRLLDANGGYRTVVAAGRMLEQGPFAGSVLVNARDITWRVAVEAELATKEEELRQSQKLEAVGQLAGGIAHDFNNLLTAISGYAEMSRLEAAALGANALEADLDEILKAAERAGKLIQQLLAFSRRQHLQSQPLELNEALRRLDRLLRRVIGEHIELVTLFADEPLWVEADPGRLEQVVLNLAVNARDAMPEGGTLTLALDGGTESATLVIRDNGCGMDVETRRRAFEPFFTTKEVGRGTGLGLATVYGIVTLSGGTVAVESAPGAGASFTVTLPRIAAPGLAESPSQQPQAGGAGRVLLVEDEPQVRTIAARMLRDAGYDVLEASEGEEALRVLAREGKIDLLLTDVVMPRLSGPELAEQVRRLRPGIEVLFSSGYANEVLGNGDLAEARFLAKPFTVTELLRAVEGALQGAEGNGQPAGDRDR